MYSIKIVARANKAKKNGEHPLYIRVIEKRKIRHISLGRSVPPEHWDAEEQRVKKGFPNSQRFNNYLNHRLTELDDQLLAKTKDKPIGKRSLKQLSQEGGDIQFLEYCERYLEQARKKNTVGTLDAARSVVKKVEKYLDGGSLSLNEIDLAWLKEYEDYLRNEVGNSQNTIKSNMKVIQRILNHAVLDDLLPNSNNPFLKYKIKWEESPKEYLTEEELKSLEEVEVVPGSSKEMHKDMYVFACYCGGMRISDILLLRWKDYDGQRIARKTKKTGSMLYIKVPDKAQAILNRYRPKKVNPDAFVFPAIGVLPNETDDRVIDKAISSRNAYANKDLKALVHDAGIHKQIHFHTSRHTWATRALRLGIPIEYVSKLMGHNSIRTTQVYAKIVNEELDKAMDKFNF